MAILAGPAVAIPQVQSTDRDAPLERGKPDKDITSSIQQLAQSDVEKLPESRLLVTPPPRAKPSTIASELLPRPNLRPRDAAAGLATGEKASTPQIITPALKPRRDIGEPMNALGQLDAGSVIAAPVSKPLPLEATRVPPETTPGDAEMRQVATNRPPPAPNLRPDFRVASGEPPPLSDSSAAQSLVAAPGPPADLSSTTTTEEIADSGNPVSRPMPGDGEAVPEKPSSALLAPVATPSVDQAGTASATSNPLPMPEIAEKALKPVPGDQPSAELPVLAADAQVPSPPNLTAGNATATGSSAADAMPPNTASSNPTQTAALPSAPEGQQPVGQEIAKAEAIDWTALRIVFAPGEQTIGDDAKAKLLALRNWLVTNKDTRIRLDAYASDTEDPISKARRISLSRAIAVRSFLIEQGVGATRINLRARGNLASEGPPDRVDIHPTDR